MKTFLPFVIMFVAFYLLLYAYFGQRNKYNRAKRELAFYNAVIKTKCFGSVYIGNHNLVSLDGGKIWYECERENTESFRSPFGGFTNHSGWILKGLASKEVIEHLEFYKRLDKWVASQNAK